MSINIFRCVPREVRYTPLHMVLLPMRIIGCVVYSDQPYKTLHFGRVVLLAIINFFFLGMQIYALKPTYWKNVGDIALGAATAIVYVTSTCQTLRILFFHKDFTYLFTYVANDSKRFYMSTDDAEQKLFKEYKFLTKFICYTMYIPQISGLLLAIAVSLLAFFTSSDLYEAEYIFDAENIPFVILMYPMRGFTKNFVIAYCAPFYLLIVGSIFITSWQVTIGILLLYPVFVLKLIKVKLENLQKVEPSKVKHDILSLIEIQMQTKQFIGKIESFISALVFIDFVLFSFLLCFLLYQFSVNPPEKNIDTFILILYVLIVSFMQLIFHLVANEICYQGNALSTSFYLSSWYSFPLTAQKAGLMLMIGSSRPIVMRALYINMNLTTFLSIMRASYGYFAMMKNMSQKID